MWTYFVRRMLQMIPVLGLITFMVYALMLAIPGDPALALRWVAAAAGGQIHVDSAAGQGTTVSGSVPV